MGECIRGTAIIRGNTGRNYDEKLISRLMEDVNTTKRRRFCFCLVNLDTVLWNSTPEKSLTFD